MATIAPPSGSACISAARAATSAHASSRVSTPATWAAASSPIEWPATKSGVTPTTPAAGTAPLRGRRSRAGCAPSRRGPRRCGRSRRGRARPGRRSRSKVSANTGKTRRSRPMPTRWLPCPVNRNASEPGRAALWVAAASARSPSASWTTARCSCVARDASARATGVRSPSDVRDRERACARSAGRVFADSTSGTIGASAAGGRAVRGGLFEDRVGVGAGDAERRHRRPPDRGGPVAGLGEQFDAAGRPSRRAGWARRC